MGRIHFGVGLWFLACVLVVAQVANTFSAIYTDNAVQNFLERKHFIVKHIHHVVQYDDVSDININ